MGHTLAGQQAAPLGTMGGLVTSAKPTDVPEGASPRTHDTDFLVGSVHTRPGLQSVYTYAGGAPTGASFTYIKTFETSQGAIKTLALDALGNWWLEDVTNTPGVLTLLVSGITAGSYARSATAQDREYVCFSDLGKGSDMPRQFVSDPTGQWIDRISQVGPAASPVFTAAQSGGDPAAITGFSITSNVVTLYAAQSYVAGEIVTISAMTAATYLNGLSFSVSSLGLSGTQFQIAFTHADVTLTTDSGTATPQYSYPIVASPTGITQNPAKSDPSDPGHFESLLWSAGPGSKTPGNTITVYYCQETQDTVLVNAVAAGDAVYVYISGAPFGNGTYLVTSTGRATPYGAGAQRYYFTYTVPTTNFQNYGGPDDATGTYQMTVATLTTTSPVPGVGVGDKLTIVGAGVANWNAAWPITKALDSGAFMITNTSCTAGVATYSWTLISGVAPTVGELVTVTNTLNGDGILNVTDVPIDSVTGTSSGTFTVAGFASTLNLSAIAESGAQATSSGMRFQFDPGILTLATANSPIYGNSGGGAVTVASSSTLTIGPGTRQGVVMFQTRNGYVTPPSPPVTFTTPTNTNYIVASQIPLGPPNTVARIIAFTEAGANLVPGANFYTIPAPVKFTVTGTQYLSSSLTINDNTTTSAKFTFNDGILLSATAIDVQGNDLFNQIELGDAGWSVAYANRMFYGLVRNKVQNLLNLSFDGGYLDVIGGSPQPLGWSIDGNYPGGQLNVSPLSGNSFYAKNTTGSTADIAMLTQAAYQDCYQQPIIRPNVAYSVRVTVRCPSGLTVGSLRADLTSGAAGVYGATYGSFSLAFASIHASFATFTGTLLTAPFTTEVPADLLLRVYGIGVGNLADFEIDRIEVFPTDQPVNSTALVASYAGNLEAFDGVTGNLDTAGENMQPCYGAVAMQDRLHLLKQSSWYYTEDSAETEPAKWEVREISGNVGTCGPNAYDYVDGEQWILTACRNGAYVLVGSAPRKITGEIFQVWNAINWAAGKTIWARNDIPNRRILIGVPMATPNFWLPNAPVNANPTSPNVVLMCNHVGMDSGEEVADSGEMHTTMMGNIVATDMRRKWSIWQIASPYADFIKRGDGLSKELLVCNGKANSKVYRLSDAQFSDDGAAIHGLYTTYGFVNGDKAKEYPLLGFFRKRFRYFTANLSGAGNAAVRFLQNTLTDPNPYTVPGGFTLTASGQEDRESPLNVVGQRVFVEVSTNAVGAYFDLSQIVMAGAKDAWNAIRGVK